MPHATPNRELETLLAYLDEQRTHAIGILEGLDEEALRRPVLPSGWSCLEMVGHLADLERFWFRRVVASDQTAINVLADDPDNPWRNGP
ncbi:MAG: DinB family protein, partial [Actinomycetota bacterium]|nr:DinB family protein [Actinomycetota bacterium]